MRARVLLILTLVAIGAPVPGLAEPERSLAVGTALRWSVWDDRLHESWDAGPSVEASFAVRRGDDLVRLGAQTMQQSARAADVPDFRSVLVFGGWEHDVPLGRSLHAFGGLRTGIQMMWFDVEKTRTVDPKESELAFGAVGGLGRDVGAWTLGLAAEYRLVMTDPPAARAFVGLDLGRRVASGR